MRIESRSITTIRPYPGNPRINDQAVDAVAESIRRFGFRVPIIVDRDGVIIAGHTRHKAALALGLTEVPVHVADDLSPEQVRALRVVDNKCAERSEWDLDLLAVEVEAIQASGIDLDLTALGFDADELDRLLETERDGLTDPDHIPAPPDAATTRRGDLWILGEHRLLCGDAAVAADVDRLLKGQPVQLVHTDPPYNVHAEPRTKNAMAAGLTSFGSDAVAGTTAKLRAKDRPILNDCMSDEDFAAALRGWFGTIGRVLEPGRAFYIWGGFFNVASYPPALAASELHFAQTLIWVKVHPSLTRKDFMLNHEWCFYGWREGAAHQFFGPASAPDVWLLGRYRSGEVGLNGGVRLVGADGSRIDITPPDDAERREILVGEEPVVLHGTSAATDVWCVKKVPGHAKVHLTEKPVELALRAIRYSSRTGEVVLDLFGGSGSTLIACEQTDRRARLLELDPLYCDVIVARWEQFTGRKAERVAGDATGDATMVEPDENTTPAGAEVMSPVGA